MIGTGSRSRPAIAGWVEPEKKSGSDTSSFSQRRHLAGEQQNCDGGVLLILLSALHTVEQFRTYLAQEGDGFELPVPGERGQGFEPWSVAQTSFLFGPQLTRAGMRANCRGLSYLGEE